MDLERKVEGSKPGFFSRIARRALPLVLAAGLGLAGLAVVGCKEEPGPISVQNIIIPSSVPSNSYIYWGIKVTNHGGKVTINSISAHERVISGWAEGDETSAYLPIMNDEISPHSTETIFSYNAYVWNYPPEYTSPDLWDLTFKNTVTVNSNGGRDSDTAIYTVRGLYLYSGQLEGEKEYPETERGVVGALSDYTK